MKKWFVMVGIVVVLLIGAYLFVSYYAVKFVQARFQQWLGPGLTIARIEVKPTYLSAKGIQYEEPISKRKMLVIEEMNVYPDLFSFLKGTLGIRKWMISRPSFFFYRSRGGRFVGPWATPGKEEKGEGISAEREKKGKDSVLVKVGGFRILKGSFDFEDMKPGGSPAEIRLREVDLELKDFQYPFISSRSPIELKGKIRGEKQDGSFDAKGWLDLKNMDMETSVRVKEVDIKVFEPYYRKRVSAEIETGHVNMDAKIAVKKRMLDAPGQLELADLRIKEGGGTVLWVPAKYLISILKDKGNRIKVQFHVKGNMDDPQFSLQETFITRVAISLAETLGIPIKVIGETTIGGTGKGAEGFVEGLKSVEKLFKRKKGEKR
jgi:hypothetical protein